MEREGELIQYIRKSGSILKERTQKAPVCPPNQPTTSRGHSKVLWIPFDCSYVINYYLESKGIVGEHLVGLQSDDRNLAIDPHSECVDKALSWHGDECKQQEQHKDEGRMEMSSLKNRSKCLTLICWSTHKWEKTASCQAAGPLTIRQSIHFGRKALNCIKTS